MVEETVWVEKEYVRPRLNSDELWLIHRLIDGEYWLLRRHPHPFWDLEGRQVEAEGPAAHEQVPQTQVSNKLEATSLLTPARAIRNLF